MSPIPKDVASQLGRTVDVAFERDWEIDSGREGEAGKQAPVLVRRREGATEHAHSLWALYRWLKHRYLDQGDLKKLAFPMRGDGMPSLPGAPRRWEWTSSQIRVRGSDLAFLTGGPLFDVSGDVLVPPIDPGDRWVRPPDDLEREIEEFVAAWEFIPKSPHGPHVIRLKDPAPKRAFRVEVLYWAAARFSSSMRGAVYAVPMDRDRPPLLIPPRRYVLSKAWVISDEDVQHLTAGPLYSGSGRQLVLAADDNVVRLNMEEIDTFSDAATLRDAGVKALLPKGWLKDMSESKVKRGIHAIVGDSFVRRDWGGERSDVYTGNVHVGGRRVHTAMALKGPSAGRRVSIASYGKKFVVDGAVPDERATVPPPKGDRGARGQRRAWTTLPEHHHRWQRLRLYLAPINDGG